MLDFNAVLNDFRSTDLDPRELVLLYKNLLVYNGDTLKKHFTKTEFTLDIKNIINQYKTDNNIQNINVDAKIAQSKKVVAQILELKNQ